MSQAHIFTHHGVSLGYRDSAPAGADAAYVFLSGWGFGSVMGQIALEELAPANARCISIDPPGIGAVEDQSAFVYIPRLARAVAALLRELGVHEGVIMGHAFGSMVVQEMAMSHDDVVGRLVLLAPVSGMGMAHSLGQASLPTAMSVMNRLLTGQKTLLEALYTPDFLLQLKETLGDIFTEVERPAAAAALSGQIWAASRWTNWGRTSQIYQPTIILQGDADPLTTVSHAQRLANMLPAADLHILKCGHLPYWECAEDMKKVLAF